MRRCGPITSLAVGIALTSTMFSAIDALLIRPLPYDDAHRIVRVWSHDPEAGQLRGGFSPEAAEHMRKRSRGLDMAAFVAGGMNLTASDVPERVHGLRVTGNFLRVLGVTPLMGRSSLGADEAEDASGLTILISEGLWLRVFGGDRAVLGTVLQLDGQPYTVTGVVANESVFPHRTVDFYIPLRGTAEFHEGIELSVIGRLVPGSSIEAAAEELNRIGTSSAPDQAGGDIARVMVERLDRAMFDQAFRTGAAICLVAVIFVLLIACSNAANLLLARAATRQHEIALRVALGASRGRLIRQLLTECMLLALAGGAAGVLLSYWGIQGVISIMPVDIPLVDRMALDGRVLLFTLCASLLAGLLAGAGPAFHHTNRGIASVPQGAGRWGTGDGRHATRVRSSIVVGQIALAMVLLINAGLLIKGYKRAMAPDLGFETDRLLTMRVSLPENDSYDLGYSMEVLSALETALVQVGGIEGVAMIDALPATRWGRSVRYSTRDANDLASSVQLTAELRSVASGFFSGLGIDIVDGRTFNELDRAGDPPVVVINDFLARSHWADESPVGAYIRYNGRLARVVGVVTDVNEWGAAAPPPRTIYAPLTQEPARSVAIAVRSDLSMETLVPRIRSVVGRVDPTLPITEIATMDDLIHASQPRNRLMVRLLGILAMVATLLAVVGAYGVMAYNVARRRPEIGIRAALGARTADNIRLILGHGARLAGMGILIGIAAALSVTRFLASLSPGAESVPAITPESVPPR